MKPDCSFIKCILIPALILLSIKSFSVEKSSQKQNFQGKQPPMLEVDASKKPLCVIPWTEDWTTGSFAYNAWTFTPEQGPWCMVATDGNPMPTAAFLPSSNLNNYSYCMQSVTFGTAIFDCSSIYLSFDIKLEDTAQNGTEHLKVEAYWLAAWHEIADFSNQGSFDWANYTYDLTEAVGHLIALRFTTFGNNSDRIVGWYLDNISLSALALPPLDLNADITYQPTGDVAINLIWNSPDCPTVAPSVSVLVSHIFDDGSYEASYPISAYQNVELGNKLPIFDGGILESFDVYFTEVPGASIQQLHFNIYNYMGFLIGTSEPFLPIANTWRNVLVPDSLSFFGEIYAMIHWDSLPTPTNALAIDQNGPYVSQQLGFYKQGNQWQLISSLMGADGVFLIRANTWIGGDKVTSIVPVVNENYKHGLTNLNATKVFDIRNQSSKRLRGYNVYQDGQKINSDLVPDTTFSVQWQPGTSPEFKVSCVHEGLSGDMESDFSNSFTVNITDAEKTESDYLSILPNPANRQIQVNFFRDIQTVELINTMGSVVLQQQVASKSATINVGSLQNGVYIVRITDCMGKEQITKLCIYQ